MQDSQEPLTTDESGAMKVMEVAVEAVMTRIVQFSFEVAPQGRRKRLWCAVSFSCIVFACIPNLLRLRTTALEFTAVDIVVVFCSAVISSVMLGAQVGYMWMVAVDINRRHVRLEVLGYIFQLNGKRHGILRYNRFPLLLQDSP